MIAHVLLAFAAASTVQHDMNGASIEGSLAKPDGSFIGPPPAGLLAVVRVGALRHLDGDKDGFARALDRARALARDRPAEAVVAYTALLCVDDRLAPCVLRDRAEPQLEHALHELAWTLEVELGRRKDAHEVYRLLLRHSPRSTQAAHAHLALAEASFAEAALASARAHYERVLSLNAASLHAFARYKLAWIALNEGRLATAFALFREVAVSDKTMLGRAAARDAVRTFAQFGRPEEAAAAFATIDDGPSRVTAMLERLFSFYLDQGSGADALAVADIIESRPDASIAKRCDRQVMRLRAHLLIASSRDIVLREALALLTLGEACATDADTWTTELARAWRREAQRTKSIAVGADADALCASRAHRRSWPTIDACVSR